eukprot:IDg10087t1
MLVLRNYFEFYWCRVPLDEVRWQPLVLYVIDSSERRVSLKSCLKHFTVGSAPTMAEQEENREYLLDVFGSDIEDEGAVNKMLASDAGAKSSKRSKHANAQRSDKARYDDEPSSSRSKLSKEGERSSRSSRVLDDYDEADDEDAEPIKRRSEKKSKKREVRDEDDDDDDDLLDEFVPRRI